MPTIEIIGWEDFVGGSAWDAHAKSELRRRLRSGLDAPLHEIKQLGRRIEGREVLSLHKVREEAFVSVTQILRIMGAQLRLGLDDANDERLFKKSPKRRV